MGRLKSKVGQLAEKKNSFILHCGCLGCGQPVTVTSLELGPSDYCFIGDNRDDEPIAVCLDCGAVVCGTVDSLHELLDEGLDEFDLSDIFHHMDEGRKTLGADFTIDDLVQVTCNLYVKAIKKKSLRIRLPHNGG